MKVWSPSLRRIAEVLSQGDSWREKVLREMTYQKEAMDIAAASGKEESE
jgi:hypothetical protein